MEKEFKIKSVDEFDKLILKNDYLQVIPKGIIEKFVGYQGFAIISEEENQDNLLTQLTICPCKKVREIFYKIEIIKENLNKYAKEGIENPEECTIENIRQDLLKIKSYFGEEWTKEYSYNADKYEIWRKIIKLPVSLMSSVIIDNIDIIADKANDKIVILGEKFGKKLTILIKQGRLTTDDFGNWISELIMCLAGRYKNVQIDFQFLNRGIKYEEIKITSGGSYILTNLNCSLFEADNCNITIKDSIIDKLVVSSNNIKSITIDNLLTRNPPKISINKKLINNLRTYWQLKSKKREIIREILSKEFDWEQSSDNKTPTDRDLMKQNELNNYIKMHKSI